MFSTPPYANLEDATYMYSDAAISWSGDDYVLGLDPVEFHTYRFESPDGVNYRFSVDGFVYMVGFRDSQYNGYSWLFFHAKGGCTGDEDFPIVNEFDFVRYGTISDGERIATSFPSAGFVDSRSHAPLDRFLVTFDKPGYVYVDEIIVEVLNPPQSPLSKGGGLMGVAPVGFAGIAPAVVATKRLDNGAPEVLEIVLDRPIPLNATTEFLLDTGGAAPELVSFTFAPGDTDGDGDADMADFAYFQSCFGPTSPCPLTGPESENCGPCLALDQNGDAVLTPSDYAAFVNLLAP